MGDTISNLCSAQPGPPAKKRRTAKKSANLPKGPSKNNFGRDPTLKKEDFILDGLKDQTVVREPGTVKGQQFIVQDCAGCDIFLLDHSATVQIDDCTDCRIFVGPCESSVFVRDCTGCALVVACQQLRTRDCKDVRLLLYCQTAPIIETSTRVAIGCFDFGYFSLREHFALSLIHI